MTDLDQGGQGPNADAMPGPNQAGHANAVRRRRRRQAKAYECVYRHIEDDRLKEMLHALPNNDRRGAAAWALLQAQCDQGANDLVTLDIKKDYQNLSIDGTIGHNEETLTTFNRYLNALNARLIGNDKYSEDDLTIKFLSNIDVSELALDAVKEIHTAPGVRQFERVSPGGLPVRDYAACVAHFDQLWRGLFKQGLTKQRAAGRRHEQS